MVSKTLSFEYTPVAIPLVCYASALEINPCLRFRLCWIGSLLAACKARKDDDGPRSLGNTVSLGYAFLIIFTALFFLVYGSGTAQLPQLLDVGEGLFNFGALAVAALVFFVPALILSVIGSWCSPSPNGQNTVAKAQAQNPPPKQPANTRDPELAQP